MHDVTYLFVFRHVALRYYLFNDYLRDFTFVPLGCVLNNLQINTKNNGAKKITKTVANIIPPMTDVPIAFLAFAPATVLITKGNTPRIKASEVMIIGRKRILQA